MERVCFRMQVDPAHLSEYIERHRAVWPGMLAALQETGWNNYSLFADPRGMIIGYLETEDYEGAQRGMELTTINAKWQSSMSEHFASGGSFNDGPLQLEEIFHLDDQLARIETSTYQPFSHNTPSATDPGTNTFERTMKHP